ncbi:MAG: MarR family transcriptional regulator [Vallitalea sp.]|jgi:DNA-binding MarR family transcriptional regulator|nr:MarR family transcriptional regulator [Vallitalea sp.]
MQKEKLIDIIFNFMPLINHKLFKDVRYKNSIHQMRLISIVDKHDGEPMKYFCDKLMIPKSNMTKIVNRLIEEEFIERKTDEKDRRIINLYITQKGKKSLEQHKKDVKQNLSLKLDGLSNEEINKLIKDFEEIECILNKL